MDVDLTLRSILVAVFAVAAFSKLRSASSFRDFAESLRPLGAARSAPAVVAGEVLVVVLLLTRWVLKGCNPLRGCNLTKGCINRPPASTAAPPAS